MHNFSFTLSGHFLGRLVKNVPLAILCWVSTASAQGQSSNNASSDTRLTSFVEEIIVTGTAGGSELSKLDASFAISTLDDQDIAEFSPKSTADLLKAIPGVWAESSGGVSGANITVRGLPGTGDAPWVTLQVQGVPIYTPPTLSFLENSTLFRIDETVKRVEALRGGSNPVLSNGQPGLTTNFILKEGSEESEGSLKYTVADYGLQRVDAVLSGEISEGLYYMVGGYVSSSEGIREAGFNANEGSQLTINITKELENGHVNFYHRQTDDSGTWYLPVPLNVPGIDSSYVQVSSANRNTVVEGPFGEDLIVDYGDGRGWDGSVSGGSIELDVGNGWTLVDRFNYLQGDADTLGLVPRGGPRTIGDLGLESATTLITGRTLSTNDFVQHLGFWTVRKDIDSFTNDLSLIKDFDDGSSLTFGYFSSRYGADDLWNLNNNARYLELGNQREQVIIDCEAIINAPSSCQGGFRVNSRGDARTDSIYVSGSYQVSEALRIDAGVRAVNHEISYVAETGGDPITGLTGTSNINTEYDESDTAWTLGANYSLNENSGVFVRVNDGSRLPYFDDIRGGQTRLAGGDDLFRDVTQYELGYKFAGNNVSIYATAFFVETEDSRSLTPEVGGPTAAFENEGKGLELDARYITDGGLSIALSATYLDAEITADPDPTLIGNETPRQPQWQFRFSPSYDFNLYENVSGTVYGALTAVADRFSNNQNTQPLPSYEKVDLGVIIRPTENLSFQLAADNLTDEQGLTEGDPRSFDINTNGRFILPRSIKFSVGYDFF